MNKYKYNINTNTKTKTNTKTNTDINLILNLDIMPRELGTTARSCCITVVTTPVDLFELVSRQAFACLPWCEVSLHLPHGLGLGLQLRSLLPMLDNLKGANLESSAKQIN
jgi:hypothetical protein